MITNTEVAATEALSDNPDLVEQYRNTSSHTVQSTLLDKLCTETDRRSLSGNTDRMRVILREKLESDWDPHRRYVNGLPVEKNGKRLVIQNPRNDTLHIARTDQPENLTMGWSVCGSGNVRGKNEENAFYLTDNELEDEYVSKDGEIIGKLCGNCSRQF